MNLIILKKGKRQKGKPIPSLKNKAWKLLSLIVRLSDADSRGIVYCFTCGSPHFWKDIQGGHFVHGHYKPTFLTKENVRPQCVACNKWRNGNLAIYAEKLGDEAARLQELSYEPFKPAREYYEHKIAEFKPIAQALEEKFKNVR